MKSPIQRRVAIAALLLAPALTACGFNAQTDQVYQPAVGVIDRSGAVNILNAVIVSGEPGSGTFAGTLVNTNTTQDDQLTSVTGPGITASRHTVAVPADGVALLADTGQLVVRGAGVQPGALVELTFTFQRGQTTTVNVPVVAATGDYTGVPLPHAPTTSSSPSSPSSPSSSSSSSSPSSSPSASATAGS